MHDVLVQVTVTLCSLFLLLSFWSPCAVLTYPKLWDMRSSDCLYTVSRYHLLLIGFLITDWMLLVANKKKREWQNCPSSQKAHGPHHWFPSLRYKHMYELDRHCKVHPDSSCTNAWLSASYVASRSLISHMCPWKPVPDVICPSGYICMSLQQRSP